MQKPILDSDSENEPKGDERMLKLCRSKWKQYRVQDSPFIPVPHAETNEIPVCVCYNALSFFDDELAFRNSENL